MEYSSDSEDEHTDKKKTQKKELTHVEEQAKLKQDFLNAGNKLLQDDDGDDNDDDDFLSLRTKSKEDKEKEEKEDEEFWNKEKERFKGQRKDGDDILQSFWHSENLDENEKFLRK